MIETPGTLRQTASGYFAQFSIGKGARKGAVLTACGLDEGAAKKRQLVIAGLVAKLRESGHTGVIKGIIKEAAKADTEEMQKVVRLVARIVAGKQPGLSHLGPVRQDGMTVEKLADEWTSGRLSKTFPDHVKVKRSAGDDKRILDWLSAVRMPDGSTFGSRPVTAVCLDDLDHVMGSLPKTAKTSATRRQYAQSLKRALALSVYPLRLRTSSPVPLGWLPKVNVDRAKAWLYPAEDAKLMACVDVPIEHRILFGFLIREGMRLSEAINLTWADVDLERGVVRLDKNKTDDPRAWAMGADVTRALVAWKRLRGSKAKRSPAVFPKALYGPLEHLADKLRGHLLKADIKRPELTVSKPGRLHLRVHDLRGSFVTLALANGRTEAWVTDRTGHRSTVMLARYKRASRTASELSLGWLAPLDEAIPELAEKGPKGANGVQTGGPRGRETHRPSPGSHEKATPRDVSGRGNGFSKSAEATPREGSSPSFGTQQETASASSIVDGAMTSNGAPVCTSVCTSTPEQLRALAAQAGQWDIVADLTAEIRLLAEERRALRLDHDGVADLGARRSGHERR